MSIQVTEPAAQWYIKELGLKRGDSIRFFVRYSSGGGLHPGFSLGIAVEPPQHPVLQHEAAGITFYMEDQDYWYLKSSIIWKLSIWRNMMTLFIPMLRMDKLSTPLSIIACK